MPARRARRRARRDVLRARRPREPRGGRAGLRGGRASARRLGAHRLRGDEDRDDDGAVRGVETSRARSRPAPSCAQPACGRRRSRARSASSSPSQPYLREVGFTGPDAGLPGLPLTVDFSTGSTSTAKGPGSSSEWPTPTSRRARRTDRPGVAREGHGGGRAPPAVAARHGHRRRLEGLLRGDARPQRAGRRVAEASRFLYATGFSGHGFLQARRSARSSATSSSARAVRRRLASLGRAVRPRRTQT